MDDAKEKLKRKKGNAWCEALKFRIYDLRFTRVDARAHPVVNERLSREI
jgi:hypothetical protein